MFPFTKGMGGQPRADDQESLERLLARDTVLIARYLEEVCGAQRAIVIDKRKRHTNGP